VPASPRSTHRTSRRIGHGPRDGIPAAEFAANAVRAALFDGELKPGDQVNQYVWADRLGISRSALREGLKILTGSKVLDHDPNRGYRVAEMGLAEMAELYWLRIAVDRENALSCRAPSEEEIVDLGEALGAIATAFENRDPLSATAAERNFMFKIYDLSERKLLAREAKRLWDLAAMYRSTGLERAVTERPEELERVLRRRTEELEAVKRADGYALAEMLVNDRRDMIKRFDAMAFFPRS
jgi:DNA-binding GntR family transcriptional regulator